MMNLTRSNLILGALTVSLLAGCTGSEGIEGDLAAPGVDMLVSSGRLPAQANLSVDALHSDASLASDYEAMVSAKPAAGPGTSLAPSEVEALTTRSRVLPSTTFSMSLSLPKSDYILGEPVIARVTLTNTSDKAQEIAPLLDPVFDRFQVTITTPDGSHKQFMSTVTACTLPKVAIRTLEPGQTWTHDVHLFAAKQGWMYNLTGEYSIQAELLGMTEAGRRVVAEPVELTVLTGTAEEVALAQDLMKGEAALLLDYMDGDQFTQGRATLEKVVADHPTTLHAIYAGFVLGNMWANDFSRAEGVRAADPTKAITYLSPVVARLNSEGGPVVAPKLVGEASNLLANAYVANGQKAQARTTLETFIQTWSGDTSQADAVKMARDTLQSL